MAKTNRGGRDRGRGRGKGRGRGRGKERDAFGRGHGGRRSVGGRGQQEQQQQQQQHQQRVRRDASQDKKPPLVFPGFRGPEDRFVDSSHPQFEGILKNCYEGFCVEGSDTFKAEVHDNARQAFDALEEGGVFRTDVTQPFGLGTKCAATYVTRTLAGEPGTTYKYLGIRMFSHPWTGEGVGEANREERSTGSEGTCDNNNNDNRVSGALQRIRLLNDELVKRSKRLLDAQQRERSGRPGASSTITTINDEKSDPAPATAANVSGSRGGVRSGGVGMNMAKDNSSKKRGKSWKMTKGGGGGGGGSSSSGRDAAVDGLGMEPEPGSCLFNVALINRMEPSEDRPDLKEEPIFGQDRCSVSWHADSCLEHYSTIGVYHVTDPETDPADWRIALRVEHDVEGPAAGKLKHAGKKADTRAPPVAVALPSRSAYFLLDEFNHHHQHAVLAGRSHRWSSTHRVAKREGHTLDYIRGRCQAVLKDGHRRTLKQWKAEQQTLSDLEFEWIRQFYVQGRAHYDLHRWWHGPLRQLLGFWSLLEQRTEVVVNTLEGASESCFDAPHHAHPPDDHTRDGHDDDDGNDADHHKKRKKRPEHQQQSQRQRHDPKNKPPPQQQQQKQQKKHGDDQDSSGHGDGTTSTTTQAAAAAAAAGGGSEERKEKKARQKRTKQRQAVDALGGRAAYAAIAEALHERAEKRKLWLDREADKVFKRLDEDAKPMPCPLFTSPLASSPLPSTPASLQALANAVLEWSKIYGGEKGVRGGGLPRQAAAAADGGFECARAGEGPGREGIVAVKAVAEGDKDDDEDNRVEGFDDKISTNSNGRQDGDHGDYCSGGGLPGGLRKTANSDDATATTGDGSTSSSGDEMSPRPKVAPANKTESREMETSGDGAAPSVAEESSTLPISSSSSSTSLPPTSACWGTDQFALEMQAPWTERLLNGEKTVETRAYPLPAGLVGRWIELVESRAGRDGVSALGDVVEAGAPGLAAVGKVMFRSTEPYKSRKAWAADADKHLVPSDSAAYGWKGPGSVHGWVVGKVKAFGSGNEDGTGGRGCGRPVPNMVRRFRSLFQVMDDGTRAEDASTNDNIVVKAKGKKKRSRKRKLTGPESKCGGGEKDAGGIAKNAQEVVGGQGSGGNAHARSGERDDIGGNEYDELEGNVDGTDGGSAVRHSDADRGDKRKRKTKKKRKLR